MPRRCEAGDERGGRPQRGEVGRRRAGASRDAVSACSSSLTGAGRGSLRGRAGRAPERRRGAAGALAGRRNQRRRRTGRSGRRRDAAGVPAGLTRAGRPSRAGRVGVEPYRPRSAAAGLGGVAEWWRRGRSRSAVGLDQAGADDVDCSRTRAAGRAGQAENSRWVGAAPGRSYPPDGLAGDSPAERGGPDRRRHPVYPSARPGPESGTPRRRPRRR